MLVATKIRDSWAGRHKQELELNTTEGTQTGKNEVPANAGQQRHKSRKWQIAPTRATKTDLSGRWAYMEPGHLVG